MFVFYVLAFFMPLFFNRVRKLRSLELQGKAISDDFYKECSLKYLEQEYDAASELMQQISDELKLPFCKEGRQVNAYQIMSCFPTAEERRLKMTSFYSAQMEKQRVIKDEFVRVAMKDGFNEIIVQTMAQNSDTPAATLHKMITVLNKNNERKMVNVLQSYDMLQNDKYEGCTELATHISNPDTASKEVKVQLQFTGAGSAVKAVKLEKRRARINTQQGLAPSQPQT